MSDNQLPAAQGFNEGKALRLDGQYELAITILQRAVAADPAHAEAHLELGLAYSFTGLFYESLDELQQAAALDPTSADIRLHLGKTYTMLGMYDEGLIALRAVLELCVPGSHAHNEAVRQLSYFTQLC